MKAKEFIPASKPRNFVAKNQKTAGAGAHKDKKKAAKQGDVKHKTKEIAEVFNGDKETGTTHKGGVVTKTAHGIKHTKTNYDDGTGEKGAKRTADGNKSRYHHTPILDKDIDERVRDPEDWDEGNTEPPNNFAVYINGKKWKVFQGRGTYADDYREKTHYQQLRAWADKKSAATGKKWTVSPTGEPATE